MATLSANVQRRFEVADDVFNDLPVVATDIIYEGAAVGDNGSGYARPLQTTDEFWGFAVRKVDNSSGSAGDVNVRVRAQGLIQLSVTGVTAVTDVNTDVYASDDNTFTLTASGASLIGTIVRWISGTTCVVRFQAASMRSI